VERRVPLPGEPNAFQRCREKAAEIEPTGSDERVGDRRKFPPLTPQNSKVVRPPLEHQTFIESPVHPVNEKLYYVFSDERWD